MAGFKKRITPRSMHNYLLSGASYKVLAKLAGTTPRSFAVLVHNYLKERNIKNRIEYMGEHIKLMQKRITQLENKGHIC